MSESSITEQDSKRANSAEQDLDPIQQAFQAEVHKWFYASEKGPEGRLLERQGQISISVVPSKLLTELFQSDRLHFRERKIFQNELRDENIKLPLNPSHPFDEDGQGPVLMVRTNGGRDYLVINGNHRTYKVANENTNAEEHPLLAVVFKDIESAQQYLGRSIDVENYTANPDLVSGGRSYGEVIQRHGGEALHDLRPPTNEAELGISFEDVEQESNLDRAAQESDGPSYHDDYNFPDMPLDPVTDDAINDAVNDIAQEFENEDW